MKISGFTFGHNLVEGGFPFVESISTVRPYVHEIVAVDIESTDETPKYLNMLCEKVLTSPWGGRDTTPNAFLKHAECKGDVIIFFEADEVYDESLLDRIMWEIDRHPHLAVYRLQLEQNFQRCREYPIPVHRIFPKGQGTYHIHPTIFPSDTPVTVLQPTSGYLWDCSNNFKENWYIRKNLQSQIWGPPRYLRVAGHFAEPNEVSPEEERENLQAPHWAYTSTPFNIPDILRKHLGRPKYEVII